MGAGIGAVTGFSGGYGVAYSFGDNAIGAGHQTTAVRDAVDKVNHDHPDGTDESGRADADRVHLQRRQDVQRALAQQAADGFETADRKPLALDSDFLVKMTHLMGKCECCGRTASMCLCALLFDSTPRYGGGRR